MAQKLKLSVVVAQYKNRQHQAANKLRRICALSFLLMVMPVLPAQASFFLECTYIVSGDITPDKDGWYRVKPIKSIMMSDGVKTDEPCHGPKGRADPDYPMKVKISGDKPKGMNTIELRYVFFNGMGPRGVINSESWTFIPVDQ